MTLLFNAGTGQVRELRSKEESHDYRYFPDPDLPPLVLAPEWIAEQRAALPELPEARRARLEIAYGLPAYDARVLTSEVALAEYFESVVSAGVERQDRRQLGHGRRDDHLQRVRRLSGRGRAAGRRWWRWCATAS